MENKNTNPQPIQIFSHPDESIGINVVKSPVKLTILEMLRNSEMEFDEIVSNTGKSKSTISVHLKSLREKGIIAYKIDPEDNRKKIFYLKSKFIGSIDNTEPSELDEAQAEYLIENIVNNDEEFSLLLFHTIRSMLLQEGMNIDTILNDAGKKIGEAIYNKIYDEDLDVFVDNLAEFWETKGLGILDIKIGQIIKITSHECFECKFLPKTGKPACFLDAGIFESVFAQFFDLPISVIETRCYTMGDEECTFDIEPLGISS